jgi:hypothetical protein
MLDKPDLYRSRRRPKRHKIARPKIAEGFGPKEVVELVRD